MKLAFNRQWIVLMLAALFPFSLSAQDWRWGIVSVSVCNVRSTNDFSAEMETQALMGTPVKVLDVDGWIKVETPEGYPGWVHRFCVQLVTPTQLHEWNVSEKVVVTAHTGTVYSEPSTKSQQVSDVVGGDRLLYNGQKRGFYAVKYPDGREGYLSKHCAMREGEWRKQLKQDEQSILATAKSLLGVPYLWGGMSSKGMDCSGFVRTVLFMHDIIIPRNASQMCHKGQRLEIAPDYTNLQPGDLVFFGRKATADTPERVSHVGFYMGNKRFIHSLGDVRIGSFDPNDSLYDSYNLGRLLFATRILPYINEEEGLTTTQTNSLYLK